MTSISLANLQGAASIPPFVTTPERQAYEFRVYQHLAELSTSSRSGSRTPPTPSPRSCATRRCTRRRRCCRRASSRSTPTAASPRWRSRRRRTTSRATASTASSGRPTRRRGSAQPLVKTHLAELARGRTPRRRRATPAPTTREAVRWYWLYLRSFPSDADAARTNFLLAELLFEDRHYAEAALEYEKTVYDLHLRRTRQQRRRRLSRRCSAMLALDTPRRPPRGRRCGAAASRARCALAPRSAATRASRWPSPTPPRKFYALGDAGPASDVAGQVLAMQPPAPEAQRRVALDGRRARRVRARRLRPRRADLRRCSRSRRRRSAPNSSSGRGERVQAGRTGARRRRRPRRGKTTSRASRRSRRRMACAPRRSTTPRQR